MEVYCDRSESGYKRFQKQYCRCEDLNSSDR